MADFAARRRMMVDTQVRPSDVTRFPIIDAMLTVPRELFVPATMREAAYVGENLDLGGGRVVLEPRSLAKMLESLAIGPTDLVLDVAPGFGYSTAVIAQLAEAVVAVEPDSMMAAEAQAALTEAGIDNAAIVTGEATAGDARHGPFDAMLIQGGVQTLPEGLTSQLADGGRIAAIFMQGALGTCRIGRRIGGQLSWRHAFNAAAPVLDGFEKKAEFEF